MFLNTVMQFVLISRAISFCMDPLQQDQAPFIFYHFFCYPLASLLGKCMLPSPWIIQTSILLHVVLMALKTNSFIKFGRSFILCNTIISIRPTTLMASSMTLQLWPFMVRKSAVFRRLPSDFILWVMASNKVKTLKIQQKPMHSFEFLGGYHQL